MKYFTLFLFSYIMDLPEMIIDKINGYTLDLHFIEHKQKLDNTLKKIESMEITDTETYRTIWSTFADGTLDDRFMIFCCFGIITYAMIDLDKKGKIYKLRDSWIYKNNKWNYSKKEYLR